MPTASATTLVAPVTDSGSNFAPRMAGVGFVVFVANAGLLVLQLVAGRLLSPFIGSSLETWTSVIAAFLAGIAVGNAAGGRWADRAATAGKLALFLVFGGVAALWMVALPLLLNAQPLHTALPLTPRIPVLAFALCFPVAFALSVLTPLAIRIGVPDVRRTGLVSGLVFGLSTLGCLLGNYLTGFVLIPELSVNQIVIATATVLVVLAAAVFGLYRKPRETTTAPLPHPSTPLPAAVKPALTLPVAFAVVFLCSFAGMTLELTATRLLAPVVGVSIYTWTGVIGVMLAGTCLGNWLGGILADLGGGFRTAAGRQFTAALCMCAAGTLAVGTIVLFGTLIQRKTFEGYSLVPQILLWTFSLFFLPMLLLGTISPQVIRLAVPDVSRAGRTAGRVYAWSTAGAIAGTFATGYVLISTIGVLKTLLLTAVVPCVAAALTAPPNRHSRTLYLLSIAAGAVFGGGVILVGSGYAPDAESNYYTIVVTGSPRLTEDRDELAMLTGPAGAVRDLREMNLDHLTHSMADLTDPTFLYYKHEQIQLDAVYVARQAHPAEQRVLVIGGGGYTFPRCVRTLIPTSNVEVVEIDPAVTAVAVRRMGLDPTLVTAHHMDGRQFVAERAAAGTYHVVTLDAVNDYSVPYHLLTKECNEAVKRTLADDGVYLVTVIDEVYDGKLWKAAYHTLKESFPHVSMVFPKGALNPDRPRDLQRSVIVLYASGRPLDVARWSEAKRQVANKATDVYVVPDSLVQDMLRIEKRPIVLTDQFSPVDNLMMQVFQKQWKKDE